MLKSLITQVIVPISNDAIVTLIIRDWNGLTFKLRKAKKNNKAAIKNSVATAVIGANPFSKDDIKDCRNSLN